ncbi:MAG: SMC-Scp complex subunit ScpB [Parcubacteria group bacterium]|nr:MAG: SMC-Scp complex subunit ScpB [Parcubacteria group bacterium]
MAEKNKMALLESLLFAVGKPLTIKELADFLDVRENEVEKLTQELEGKYNHPESGIHIASSHNKVQMISNPADGPELNAYFKAEISGELTKASLETLTIIAYRQPISKEELEQIRGVNCSLIIRNLLIRGLIETSENKNDLATTYVVTIDFLRHLGLDSVKDLPDFEKLNNDENLAQLLQADLSDGKEE